MGKKNKSNSSGIYYIENSGNEFHSTSMKLEGAYTTIKLINCYVVKDRRPDLTDEECRRIFQMIEEAGMRVSIEKPLENRLLRDMVSANVHYKLPHIFKDDNGIKYCVGIYKRTIQPEKINDIVARLNVSKSYMRDATDPEDEWRVHITVTLQPMGHAWPYGRKESIVGHTPVGIRMIYRYMDSVDDIKEELQRNILKLKGYIDNGEPVVK